MTPSPQCAECGGLGWDFHGFRFVKCNKCRRFASTGGAIAHVIQLARTSAALLEAGEKARAVWSSQSGRVFEAMGEDNPRVLAIDRAITNLQTAIARAKEGEL